MLEEQARVRGQVGDELGEEYYTNASNWMNYIDISNQLSLDNGQRAFIYKANP